MEVFIIVTVLWVFSVCLHEFGHAWAAYCGGDHTVKDKGYFSLNPIHYADPVGSLIMPLVFLFLGGIGLPGGSVYIERERLRSRGWETWVSLAGPAMHLPLILVIVAAFRFGLVSNDTESLAAVSLGFLLKLQISAVLFNLIPVPPLDGFQALAPWFPEDTRTKLYAVSGQTIWILFLIFWFVRPVAYAFWSMVNTIMGVLGVDPYLGNVGWHAFRFWAN